MNLQIQIFHFLAGPWRFTQKFKARLYAWVFNKAIYLDKFTQDMPPKMINQSV